jgi:putative prophage primase
MAGYRLLGNAERGTREKFYIFPQVYIQDVITGFNERQANEILFNAGMLERVNEGCGVRYKIKTPHKIDDKRTRCYVLLPLVESDEEEMTEIKTE